MDHQPTTVGRYIQRFREAKPLSPGHRRRQKAILEEDFWWMKSDDSRDQKMNNNSIIAEVEGRAVLPSSVTIAQDRMGGASLSTQSMQESIREAAERTRSAEEVILSRHLNVGEKCEIACVDSLDQDSLSPFEEVSPASGSSDPGSPGPSCPKKAGSTTTESPLDRLQESFVEGVSISRPEICEESEELNFLDARASTVLEHCRRLLATPSTRLAQVDVNPPEEDDRMAFPKEKDDVSSKIKTGPLDRMCESLEQRTMMICHGDRQKFDTGQLSRLHKNRSHKELREWGNVGPLDCSLAPPEEVHNGFASCMMPASRNSDEHPALRGHIKHGGGLPSFCGHVEWLGHPDYFPLGTEAQGSGGSRALVSKPDLGAARSKYIASGSHSVCPCVSNCHVQFPTSEGISSCGLPQLTRTLEGQTRELSKTNLLVRKTRSATFEGDFSEDAVVSALIHRGDQIQAELERRRLMAVQLADSAHRLHVDQCLENHATTQKH